MPKLLLTENGKPTETTFANLAAANEYMRTKGETERFDWTVGWLFKLRSGPSNFEIVKADGSKIRTSPTYRP